MARFDVYASPSGSGYVLDVQADVLEGLNTRIVVPLLPVSQAPVPAKRLNPVFEIGSEPHVMVTQFMAAAVSRSLLRSPEQPGRSGQPRHGRPGHGAGWILKEQASAAASTYSSFEAKLMGIVVGPRQLNPRSIF